MDAVNFMYRTDTKHVFHVSQLPGILDLASHHYRALAIGGHKIFAYQSLYFDTPGLKTYLDHHNGIRPRYKIRFRKYENTGRIFLEVKRKIANERTRKTRMETGEIERSFSPESIQYISERSSFDPADLTPALWTLFDRITLVGRTSPERITIDVGLSFRDGKKVDELPFLAICEVKRDRANGFTDFMKILKSRHIYPSSCSKYCLGTLLMKEGVKYNRFKSLLRQINKIQYAHELSPFTG
jgi:hypothetical protein